VPRTIVYLTDDLDVPIDACMCRAGMPDSSVFHSLTLTLPYMPNLCIIKTFADRPSFIWRRSHGAPKYIFEMTKKKKQKHAYDKIE